MKKINIFSLIGMGLIIIVTGWLIYSDKISQFIPQGEIGAPQDNIEREVVLVIDEGEGSPETFQGVAREGMTAFDLLKEKVFGTTKKVNASRSDLLLDTLDKQAEVSAQANEIKQIFHSGLSKDKIEMLLEKRGLPNYEDSSYTMMKELSVDNGKRGNYLVNFLAGMTGQQYAQTVYKLAENEILTTGVTAKWLDDGLINETQQKSFNKVISATKGKVTSAGKLNLSSIKKISVSPAKASTPSRIVAPKVGKLPKSLLEEYDSSDFLKGFKTKL